MTNTTRRTRPSAMCRDCGIRRVGSDAPREAQLCDPCNEYAEWENEHNDNAHDSDTDANDLYRDNCPICHPELDPRNDTPRTGHHNTVAKTRTSHAGHDHPTTPKARAACRKANRKN